MNYAQELIQENSPTVAGSQAEHQASAIGCQLSEIRTPEVLDEDGQRVCEQSMQDPFDPANTQEYRERVGRASSLLKIAPSKRAQQCKHVKSNGEFCGSPALRGRSYCYFHLTHIGRRLRAARSQARAQAQSAENAVVPLDLPPFEDANSIQISLMQVVDALLHNRIDTKRAGLVLYALQTASSNLANGANFERRSGAAVAGRYDDFEEDYELGEEVPELKTDEAAEVKLTEQQERQAIAEACAKLEEARKEAAVEGQLKSLEDGREVFTCEPVVRFVCSIMGPLAGVPGRAGEQQLDEREAPSQRLEWTWPMASTTSGEDSRIPNDGMCGASGAKPGEAPVVESGKKEGAAAA